MSSSTFSVSSIIEKSDSRDKDLRHMALYDLHSHLQHENVKLDDTSQRQLADVVLKLLDDTSSDVQGMAVKCLGPLVTKMSKFQIENSVAKLSNNILKGDDEKRDIATIALKTVIAKLPVVLAVGPVKKALPLLVKALEGTKPEVKLDALEVLSDIIRRFGNVIVSSHSILQAAFLNELNNKRPAVRKRAITALALLSQCTDDKIFDKFVSDIIFGIRTASKSGGDDLRTYIQCTSQIAKTSGHRLGKKIDEFVDLLLKAAEDISTLEENVEGENDEVREYIMQALESFVLRCQSEVTVHVELIMILCNEYIEYDPNFSYEDGGEDEDDEEDGEKDEEFDDEDQDDEDQDDGGDYSDDADITWKVRKAAAKCLHAIIKTKPEQLEMMYKYLCSKEEQALLSRFKERDESVKLEILRVFQMLLHQTVTQTTSSSGEVIITQHEQICHLKDTKKTILNNLLKQAKNRSARVKHAVFSSLKDLTFTLQGGMEDAIDGTVSIAKNVLESSEQHTALKLVTLQYLEMLLDLHKPNCFLKSINLLTEAIYNRINDKYYKITSEAVKVCATLVPVIQVCNDNKQVKLLYDKVFEKLKIQDIDQDVKENAIKTMGTILSSFGSGLGKELKVVLPLLLNRLKNETTRLVTCKSLAKVAEAKVDISGIINDVVADLSSFLRKQNRPLRQASLVTLTVIASVYKKKITNTVIEELSKLVSDSDLHLAHLALNLGFEILRNSKESAGMIEKNVLPKILDLLSNSTLQGMALSSLLNVLIGLVPKVGFSKMLKTVLSSMKGDDISKQIFINIATAVAALVETGSMMEKKETIQKFQKNLSSSKHNEKMLALFTIGAIGRGIDLSGNEKVISEIQKNFDSESEEIKNAASYALGNISIGNLTKFVPQILSDISKESKKKYLLIHSLKEIIIRSDHSKLANYTKDVVPLLFNNVSSDEEGVRNVVSECLGKLCGAFYKEVMPEIVKNLHIPITSRNVNDVKGEIDGSGKKEEEILKEAELKVKDEIDKQARGKAALISAVKYTITEKPQEIDALLKDDLKVFFEKLSKKEHVDIRRAAILLLTSVAHNKPSVVRDMLARFMENLYKETKFNKKLERTINLGPFKYTVDDGLELRKSAFECLDTILSSMRENINPIKYVYILKNGFTDKNDDIVMLTHIIALKCCKYFPDETIGVVEKTCRAMQKVLKKKVKDNELQQAKERHDEKVRSTMRCIMAFSKLDGASNVLPLVELVEKIIKPTPKLNEKYQALKNEEDGSPK